MSELLLELLSEEIPAKMQKPASENLKRLISVGLENASLKFDSVKTFSTPRRLSIVFSGLPDKQPDLKEERKGPQVGASEQAIAGFLGSISGLKLSDCVQRDVKGKIFYYAVLDKKGESTAKVTKSVIETALRTLANSWPKSMRWGSGTLRWARPLHSILCLLDGVVVPVKLGALKATANTFGHRFLAPEKIDVVCFSDYQIKLKSARVLLNREERRQKIENDANLLAKSKGLSLRADEDLLDEVTGLVEWPFTLMGSIDTDFMSLPPEVLIAAMRGHQKYFSTLNDEGELASKFIFVSNMEASDDGKAIIAGNERVLRARLSDAKFFWDQDRKTGLESRLSSLKGLVFHAKLGSVFDKVGRMESLARLLCPMVSEVDVEIACRAAKLSKADLVTGLVTELPELQGLMGSYYATESGEHESVSSAIAHHYSPVGPSDICPSDPTSVIVALVDKIDTLVNFWLIGEKPTGSKDPFALRRAAIGVIRLITENKLRLPLLEVFTMAGGEEIGPDLLSFFADRLKVYLKEKGVRYDLIDAVFALGEDDLVLVIQRVDALAEFLHGDDGSSLLVAYKRAANILKIEEKKDGKSFDEEPQVSLLEEPGERALYEKLISIRPNISSLIVKEDFTKVMIELVSTRFEIDSFFDEVTVNASRTDLRENRLCILSYFRRAFDEVADFSIIEG